MFKSKQSVKHRKPTGPNILSFLAIQHKLFDPLSKVAYFQQKYGDISKIFGYFNTYYVSNPDAIARILLDNQENYVKTDRAYKGLRVLLGEGLLTNADYHSWFNMRQTLQPHYYAKSVLQQVPLINKQINNMLDSWSQYVTQNRKINICDEIPALVGNISISLQFGEELKKYRPIVMKYTRTTIEYVGLRMLPIWWLPFPKHLQYYFANRNYEQVIKEIIAEKDRIINSHDNYLSTLFKTIDPVTGQPYPDQRLIDEIKTFSAASIENLSALLTWTFYFITKYPEVEEKLNTELSQVLGDREASADDIAQLKYTRMVIEETMRYYPPAWLLTRQSITDDVLDNYFMPAGATLNVMIYNVHHHPDYWEDPEEFNPDRFSIENVRKRKRFTYIPFGAGQRTCIGGHFAVITAQLVVAKVMQRYRLTLLNKRPMTKVISLSIRPGRNIYVKAKLRGT